MVHIFRLIRDRPSPGMSVTVYFPCEMSDRLSNLEDGGDGNVRLRSSCLQILQLQLLQHTHDVTQMPIRETAITRFEYWRSQRRTDDSADEGHLSWTRAPGDTNERASRQHFRSSDGQNKRQKLSAKVFDKVQSRPQAANQR
jgi:hypothetical protein